MEAINNWSIHQAVDKICSDFPEAAAALEHALLEFYNNYRRKLALKVDSHIIISILKEDYLTTANKKAKENAAQTLKTLAQPTEGKNCNMPHLAHLHPMSRSAHFRTLCNKGLVSKLGKGRYQLTEKSWQLFELAYKLSIAKPIEDKDLVRFNHIVQMKK